VIRKTIATQSLMLAVEKALEVVGGGGIFRSLGLKRWCGTSTLPSSTLCKRSGSIASRDERRLASIPLANSPATEPLVTTDHVWLAAGYMVQCATVGVARSAPSRAGCLLQPQHHRPRSGELLCGHEAA
jgi:hypothetical protein